MYGEARKLHLIEALLKETDPGVLIEVEKLLAKSSAGEKPRKSFTAFTGVMTIAEADALGKAIEEGCEQINPDDWN